MVIGRPIVKNVCEGTISSSWQDSLRSPTTIVDLPNEILSQIFIEGTDNWRYSRPLELPFPVLISAINHHWRLLARCIASLWTLIVVPLHKEDSDCLQWISDWVELSSSFPLSVVLDDKIRKPRRSAEASTRLASEAFALVMRSVSRLQRLDISATFETISDHIDRLQDAINLQQISLCFRGPPFVSTFFMDTESGWLSNMTHLTRLRVQNAIFLNPGNLTSLIAHKLLLGYEETKTLFLGSPQLTNLVLHNIIPAHPPIPNERLEINANFLRSLAIHSHGVDERGAVYFLSFLHIPNLSYLEVDGNTRVASILGNSIASSNVRKLRISNCSKFFFISDLVESQRDISLYRSLSTIEHLELVHVALHGLIPKSSTGNRALGSAALSRKSGSMLWPALRRISMDTVSSADIAHLVDFLKSHKHVQSMDLSSTAARHLLQSTSEQGVDDTPDVFPLFLDLEETKLRVAASERVHAVKVNRIQSYRYGYLDSDRASLWEALP